MVTVVPGLTPRAVVAAREVVPTSTRSGGGVCRVTPESRGMNTPGTSPFAVCTSAGSVSYSEEKKPPRVCSSTDPSSRMPVTVKPISSRCAMNTTTGSPLPTRTHRLPAASVSACAQAGSSRFTASRTGPSAPETP